MPLKQGAAKREKFARLFECRQFASRGNEGERDDIGDRQSAIRTQVIQDAWEVLVDKRLARHQQRMRVMRLWHAFTMIRGRRENVTVNNRDLVIVLGQDTI